MGRIGGRKKSCRGQNDVITLIPKKYFFKAIHIAFKQIAEKENLTPKGQREE